MNNKQSQTQFSLLNKQTGDAVVNIVVLLGAAILAFLIWQYFQGDSADESLDSNQAVEIDQTRLSNSVDSLTTDNLSKRQRELLKLKNKTSSQMPNGNGDDVSGLSAQNSESSVNSNLPGLDESDQMVRESLSTLSDTSIWRTWLGTAQPVRKFVQFMENLSRGKVPHKYFRFMAPSGRFKVDDGSNDQYVLNAEGYRRYDRITQCIDSLDAGSVVSVYTTLEPLIQAAWSEMNPDQSANNHAFDEILLSAIKKVQTAPAIHDEIRLIRPSVMYKYADPKLERLNAVSKQMIRMGPRNTRIIQKKLDEIETLFRSRHNSLSFSKQASVSTIE